MFSAASAGRRKCVTLHPAAKAAAIESAVATRFIGSPLLSVFCAGDALPRRRSWPARDTARPAKRSRTSDGIRSVFETRSSSSRAALWHQSRLLKPRLLHYRPGKQLEEPMRNMIGRLAAAVLALALGTGFAAAQSKITIAVGGGGCLCYLPTILARQLGEDRKAGVAVELVDLKGGSDALKAMMGGSA